MLTAMKSAHLHVKPSILTALLDAPPPSCVLPLHCHDQMKSVIQYFSSSLCNFFSQRQRLIRARLSPEEGGAAGEESSGGDRTMGEGGMQQKEEEERGKGAAGVRGGGAQQKEEVENEEGEEEGEEEEEEEEEAPFKPFVMPGECREKESRILVYKPF